MRYDLIARFMVKAEDKTPLYACPLGIYYESTYGELERLGFKENKDSTPGYLDYIKENGTIEDLQSLTREGFISEVMDVFYYGNGDDGFERIEFLANEIEVFDDEGTIPPFGLFIHGTFVEFNKTEPFSRVLFIDGDPFYANENTRSFSIPLKKLKDYFEVLTMYEVRDRLRDSFANSNTPWSFDELKDYFEAGIDDAVDLAVRKLFGKRENDGTPQIMKSLSLGVAGKTKNESVAGFLYWLYQKGICSIRELISYGFSREVCWSLALLCSIKGEEGQQDLIDRIIYSSDQTAIHLCGLLFQDMGDCNTANWSEVRAEHARDKLNELSELFNDDVR